MHKTNKLKFDRAGFSKLFAIQQMRILKIPVEYINANKK